MGAASQNSSGLIGAPDLPARRVSTPYPASCCCFMSASAPSCGRGSGVAQHHRSAIGSQFVPLDPQEDQSEYQPVAGRAGCGTPAGLPVSVITELSRLWFADSLAPAKPVSAATATAAV